MNFFFKFLNVSCFRYKRDTLHRHVLGETNEKEHLQADLRKLSDALVKVNEKLCDTTMARCRLDQTIRDTEKALTNLAKGSENLLSFMIQVTNDIQPLIKEPETAMEPEPETKKRTSSRKSTR